MIYPRRRIRRQTISIRKINVSTTLKKPHKMEVMREVSKSNDAIDSMLKKQNKDSTKKSNAGV